MQRFITTILLVGIACAAVGQNYVVQRCGTTQYMNLPENRAWYSSIEQKETEAASFKYENINYAIPVVVHVVHKGEPEGKGTNISTHQILSQLEVLNEDFNALNGDLQNVPTVFKKLAGNANFQFCLANADPAGNPTTGITRTLSSVSTFTHDNKVKYSALGGSDAWPADRYLNIWVCDLRSFGGITLLGYAQLPGGPAETDGVVVNFTAFGNQGNVLLPYNRGRTCTHEIGHWLNLRHIWGDSECGDDQVMDTPPQFEPNYGNYFSGGYSCTEFPHITCGNAPYGDLWMNFMDYSFDKCMNMFTKGQTVRMQEAALLYRSGFIANPPCANLPKASGTSLQVYAVNNVSMVSTFQFAIISRIAGPLKIEVIDIAGRIVFEKNVPFVHTDSLFNLHLPPSVKGMVTVRFVVGDYLASLRIVAG